MIPSGCSKKCISRNGQALNGVAADIDIHGYERRSFLASMAGLVATSTPANAISSLESFESPPISTGNFDCLLDLPPVTSGCARLYLCRHGQTENNRLRIVQGARVDPPINRNGHEQAQRLGLAVARLLAASSSSKIEYAVPKYIVHSKLQRARETAEELLRTSSQYTTNNGSALKIYGELPSLGEVDFGSLDGTDEKSFRKARRDVFASWSVGNIDRTTGGGGESGRQILERSVQTLEELRKIATSSSSSSSPLLAVSHSTYLRMLLSLVNDSPLIESALWQIKNGSINIIDVNVEGKRRLVTSNSNIFGRIRGRIRGR